MPLFFVLIVYLASFFFFGSGHAKYDYMMLLLHEQIWYFAHWMMLDGIVRDKPLNEWHLLFHCHETPFQAKKKNGSQWIV